MTFKKTRKLVEEEIYEPAAENIEVYEEEEPMWSYDVKVNADRLRKREYPSAGAPVVGLIQDRGIYRIIREDETAQWGQLKEGCWIMLKYTEKI